MHLVSISTAHLPPIKKDQTFKIRCTLIIICFAGTSLNLTNAEQLQFRFSIHWYFLQPVVGFKPAQSVDKNIIKGIDPGLPSPPGSNEASSSSPQGWNKRMPIGELSLPVNHKTVSLLRCLWRLMPCEGYMGSSNIVTSPPNQGNVSEGLVESLKSHFHSAAMRHPWGINRGQVRNLDLYPLLAVVRKYPPSHIDTVLGEGS